VTIEQIRKAYQTKPFQPFTLRTADGTDYVVKHSEFLYITPKGRTIVVADDEGAVSVIDLLLVSSLHFTNSRPQRKTE